MNKRVLSRSMFNRTARNKLYNKGGLPSVQKFQFGGMPTLPPIGTFEELFQRSLRAGDRKGLGALSANQFIPPALKARSIQEQQRLLQEQIGNRASKNTSILDFLKNLVKPTDAQKEMSKDLSKKDDSLTGEKLKELKIPEPGPSDTEIMTSTMPPSETNLSQIDFDKQEQPKGVVTPKSNKPATEDPMQSVLDAKVVETPLSKPSESQIKSQKSINEAKAKASSLPNTLNVIEQPEKLNVVSNNIQDQEEGKSILNNIDLIKKQDQKLNLSDIDLNKKLMDAMGATKEEEDLPLEQHYKKIEEISKVLDLDVDPKEENRMRAFNIAMFGFDLAAQESPNALTNLGKAGRNFVKREMDTAKEKKKQKKELKKFNLTNALINDNAETKFFREMKKQRTSQEYDWLKTALQDETKRDIASAQIAANKANLTASLELKESMFNAAQSLKADLANLTSKDRKEIAQLQANLQIAGLDQKAFQFDESMNFNEWKTNLDNELTKTIADNRNEFSVLSSVVGNFDAANSAVYQVRRNAGLRGEDIFGTRTLDDGSKLTFMEEVAQYAKLLPSKTKLGPQPYDQERFTQDLKRTIMGNQTSIDEILAVAQQNNPGKKITTASPEFATALNQVISNLTSGGGQTTATETNEIVDLSK